MGDKFNVLVVDPPWQYNNKRTGGSMCSGSEQHYRVLSYTELQDLDDYINPIMSDDSVCFLWVTNSMLENGMDLLYHWGFEYKTMITWVKKSYGLGYWFRGKTEHLLLGVRGKVKPFRANLPNVVISPKVYRHSEKPIAIYSVIEEATKNMNPKYLELFARRKHNNWTCLGSELTGNDICTDLRNLASNTLEGL